MGAWGSGPFENDDALDYLEEMLEAADGQGDEDEPGKVTYLVGALAAVGQPDLMNEDDEDDDRDDDDDRDEDEEGDGYIEASEACCALVAAEIVAAIHGKPGPDMRTVDDDNENMKDLVKWIKTKATKDPVLTRPEVKEMAAKAVNRVREESELAELWAQAGGDGAKAWAASVEDLAKRLR